MAPGSDARRRRSDHIAVCGAAARMRSDFSPSSADRECNANPGRPAAFGWQMETMKPDDGKLPR